MSMAAATNPQGHVREAIEFLNGSVERACGLAGQGSEDARELFEIGQTAIESLRAALAAADLFYDTCGRIATKHLG